jgi:hypothetical protein
MELAVISREHGLDAKLAEVEYLAAHGGVLLEDGSVLAPTGGSDAPPPHLALKALVTRARRDEVARLEELVQRQETEIEALQKEVDAEVAALQSAKERVLRTQQHTDAVYSALT